LNEEGKIVAVEAFSNPEVESLIAAVSSK
jgi:hypothetical protein